MKAKKVLIKIVQKIGLAEVQKILNEEFHTREKFIHDYYETMSFKNGISRKIYNYMEEASLLNRKYVIPIFNPPAESEDIDDFINKLTGYDQKIWELLNTFLTGKIPSFQVTKHAEIVDIVRFNNDKGYYDIKGLDFAGYNPYLFTILDKYCQIYGNKMSCIVFTVEYDDGYETP
jgi:hypothetical protein